ncbi:GntR family transcriptional regulator [Bradyrhizobium jicamae]|uniref:GntR family transcriptional regulator n=1 Tax=Bradyrhizobium jicamae TaxID=280332 RepID=UPI001BAB31E1|nr:GntR family transcriptional regulator [Bradyrhizobium jicamae]MBR0754723.1 GntR family transcriptional regulator [Bradyrhizobium jicamae]
MTQHAKARRADDARTPTLTAIAVEKRPALATIVADRIRDAIVFGELGLGEAVSEERLASMLGVSRTPVREALTLLQLQGLIDVRPQRGSFVFQPSKADIAELCQFRVLVETGALRLAFASDRAVTLKELQMAQDALAAAEDVGDWVSAARADADFHGALFRHCGNRVFVQAYDLIAGRIGAARFFARQSEVSKRRTGAEHRLIIKHFARGDVDGAADVLTGHIDAMSERYAGAQRAMQQAAKTKAEQG